MTDLRTKRHIVICEENAPILKMALTPDNMGLWVATSESTINCWVSITEVLRILVRFM